MSKALVAYFSASGVTARVAKNLATAAGADLYEIKPAVPYTKDDLNWMNKQSRSSVEMRDKSSRPALADTDADIAAYDTIFVGFPIWWYIAPTIINTFLEAYDFSGKKIILFATSGGSGFGKAVQNLQPSAPKAQIIAGEILNGRLDNAKLKAFADKIQGGDQFLINEAQSRSPRFKKGSGGIGRTPCHASADAVSQGHSCRRLGESASRHSFSCINDVKDSVLLQ